MQFSQQDSEYVSHSPSEILQMLVVRPSISRQRCGRLEGGSSSGLVPPFPVAPVRGIVGSCAAMPLSSTA
eukprot:1095516-Lingulodinium_polyedra.AAC.1